MLSTASAHVSVQNACSYCLKKKVYIYPVSYIYIEPLHVVKQVVRSVVGECVQDWLHVHRNPLIVPDRILTGTVPDCTSPPQYNENAPQAAQHATPRKHRQAVMRTHRDTSQTHRDTETQRHKNTNTPIYTHTYRYTHINTHLHTYARVCTGPKYGFRIPGPVRENKTHMHTYRHTYTETYIYTYTHIRT